MGTPELRLARAGRASLVALGILAVVYAPLAVLGEGDAPLVRILHVTLIAGAALLTLARAALGRSERAAWTTIGLAMTSWTAAEAILSTGADGLDGPSGIDVLYLAFYPLALAGLVLLVHGRVRIVGAVVWLDGLVAAFAVTGLSALLVIDPLVDATGSPASDVALNLGYVVGDLLLAAVVLGFASVAGVALGRGAHLLLAGFLLCAVADSAYVYQSAAGEYDLASLVNVLWPLSGLVLGAAAWAPVASGRTVVREQRHGIALPIACGVLALALLVTNHEGLGLYGHANPLVTWSAAAALAAILLRLALTVRNVRALLAQRERQALTDSVTGLANRRALMRDLRAALGEEGRDDRVVLALLDLDGFKDYNDTFGHPAGDLLLARLAGRLREVARAHCGTAYRMGGDEFCVLARLTHDETPEPLLTRAAAALSDQGDAFTIGASVGHALAAPHERDAETALRIADDRMYERKSSRRASTLRQTRDLLQAVVTARDPALTRHQLSVARHAERVARWLDLPDHVVAEIRDAGALHDVGKLAIPDEVVHKRTTLTDAEWQLLRWHPVIGERIARAAPVLGGVATLIRAHHERWDGAGYPDGLAGEQIPLGAQILFVCDAFDAMTTDRVYRRAMSVQEALAQLRNGAGTQFAPRVVEAFCASWAASGQPHDEPSPQERLGSPTVAEIAP